MKLVAEVSGNRVLGLGEKVLPVSATGVRKGFLLLHCFCRAFLRTVLDFLSGPISSIAGVCVDPGTLISVKKP